LFDTFIRTIGFFNQIGVEDCMNSFYCWCENISKEDYQNILNKSSVCSEKNSKYKEEFNELCIIVNPNKLKHQNVDDIFFDLEGIIQHKLDCHINISSEKKNEMVVVQKDGVRSITSNIL
jgi:hypothetical protein